MRTATSHSWTSIQVRNDASAQPLYAIDLFAGCGGASYGLTQAGFEVLVAIENDPAAATVYRQNHRSAHLIERDIRNISNDEIISITENRPIALVLACPPCQGFSKIRTRNMRSSVNDVRNMLYVEFLRVVDALEPTSIVLENVPDFSKTKHFRTLCLHLKNQGFHLRSEILDAADFGVPQRRKRLFLVGSRIQLPPRTRPFSKRTTVREAFQELCPSWLAEDPLHNIPHKMSASVYERVSAIPTNGGSRKSLGKEISLRCHLKHSGCFNDVYGRMHWDDVSPTITSGIYSPSKGRFIHPDLNRCISLREAAVLQSFPLSYIFPAHIGKMKIASLIGNALPPKFAIAQLLSLRKALLK
jgi:DNA (cytosine-5)-methyltransferase 1